MKDLFVNNPFIGVLILAGIIPSIVGMIILAVRTNLSHRHDTHHIRIGDWKWIIPTLLEYGIVMAFVTLVETLALYLVGSLPSLPDGWVIPLHILAGFVWLCSAILLFRIMFRLE